MVRVIMGDDQTVNIANLRDKKLLPEIRSAIDQHPLVGAFDEN